MLVVNSGDVLLKGDFFDIYFFLDDEERYRNIAEIDRLGNHKIFTLGLYEYKIHTRRGPMNNKIPSKPLLQALEEHNIMARLFDDEDDNHQYAFAVIDFSVDNIGLWRQVHDFIIGVANINRELAKKHIEKKKILKKPGYQKNIEEELEIIDILDKNIANAQDEYRKFEMSKAPLLYLRKIPTTHYRKKVERYGVLVNIEGKNVPIFFKDVDQQMLYISAMLRHKAGAPIYLHELFNNSRGGTQSDEQKRKFVKWIEKVYECVIDYAKNKVGYRSVATWLKKVADAGSPQVEKSNGKTILKKKANPLYQAKSDANRCVRTALRFYPTAMSYCMLQTKLDNNNYTYYTFYCPAENIRIDEDLQAIMDACEF